MDTSSRTVSSSQRHLHPKLAHTVRRHLNSEFRKPPTRHSLAAMEQVLDFTRNVDSPLFLDSFCGTGHSTRALAEAHPDALVLGIDKSAERLRRGEAPTPVNALLLRGECTDIWRLMLQAGIQPQRHYLLYPNPWP
ncbi:MAG: SAM-dependent methyltransferase, partial [Pseudomonadota bacterium]